MELRELVAMSDVDEKRVKEMIQDAMKPQVTNINQRIDYLEHNVMDKLDAIQNSRANTIDLAIDKWMERNKVGPEHILFLRERYRYYFERESLIRRVIITTIVAALIAGSIGFAREWAINEAVRHMEQRQAKSSPKSP